MTYFGPARKPLFADSFMRQVRAVFCQMTPTAAAAPSINTRRAFLERCARGDNTARHRINLHAVPLLFSFIHSSIIPLLLLRLIPLFFFINPRFYSGLSLFTLLSLVSSFLSPYSPRFDTPLLFLPITICSSFFFSLLFLHIPLFPSLLFLHTPSSHALSLQPSH